MGTRRDLLVLARLSIFKLGLLRDCAIERGNGDLLLQQIVSEFDIVDARDAVPQTLNVLVHLPLEPFLGHEVVTIDHIDLLRRIVHLQDSVLSFEDLKIEHI